MHNPRRKRRGVVERREGELVGYWECFIRPAAPILISAEVKTNQDFCVVVMILSSNVSGRALNIYHPSKVQPLNYGPVAAFNHTEDYGKKLT